MAQKTRLAGAVSACAGVATAFCAGLLMRCEQVEPVAPAEYQLTIPSLTAQYDPGTGYVVLQWTPATGDFDFYRIYRTTQVDSSGNPVMSTLQATLQRDSVSRDSTRFYDTPEPGRGMYYYAIRAVRVDISSFPCAAPGGTCYDTIETEGELSPPGGLVSCMVGVDVRFAINHGDVFTLSDVCTLFVYDPAHAVASIRFSQLIGDSGPVIDTGTSGRVDSVQVQDLVNAGLLTSTASAVDSSPPNFVRTDATAPNATVHPELLGDIRPNSQRSASVVFYPARGLHSCLWTLLPGAGQKNVWAEVTYVVGGTTIVDTLYDFIRTQPHKVEVVWRHQLGAENASQKDTSEWVNSTDTSQGRVKVSLFYTSVFKFSVKIFGDSTIDTAFDYWYVTSPQYSISNKSNLGRRGWVMTRPIKAGLTGRGVRHSTEHVYTLSLDSTVDNGRTVLDTLMTGRGANITNTLAMSVTQNRAVVDSLATADKPLGRKEFLLITRFKEEFFRGSFVYAVSYVDTSQVVRAYRDVYPPVARFDLPPRNTAHLNNDSTIVGPFDFVLDSATSLSDAGLAKVTGIELLVAKLPTDFVWSNSTSPKGISLDSALTFSHEFFPFPVEKPESVIPEVRWDNIDPTQWSSGYYLMGVVVDDDKGTRAFAWASDAKNSCTNPWRVFIRTSY